VFQTMTLQEILKQLFGEALLHTSFEGFTA
jgi:hypothetical protein